MGPTFTLRTLMAVMTCICLLLALLLPAIQQSREASRRMSCSNNMRIIGIAVHNHNDQFKQLPHAGVAWNYPPRYINEVAQVKEQQFAGWGFQLLPFLRQRTDYLGPQHFGKDDRCIYAISEAYQEFYCPSRRSEKAKREVQAWYGPSGTYSHGATDYAVANMDGDNGAIVRLVLDQDENPVTSGLQLSDISDGTSNVLLFGEKRLALRELMNYPFDDNEGYTAGWDCDTVRGTGDIKANPITLRRPLPDFWGRGDGDCRFGSSHPKGFNITLADASVRFISYDIDGELFARLGCRDDGASIQVPD
ncbi:MAG: DUF1559 domain-containing protein [Planctomycetaceae bacterium]